MKYMKSVIGYTGELLELKLLDVSSRRTLDNHFPLTLLWENFWNLPKGFNYIISRPTPRW